MMSLIFRIMCLMFAFLAARISIPQSNGDEAAFVIACMLIVASALCWWMSDLLVDGGKG